MRIIIDTDLQVVIVPNSYYNQVDALNEIIEAAGGKKLDYTEYINTLFQKAYSTKIIRQSDVAGEKGKKNKNKARTKGQQGAADKPAEDKKPAEEKKEGE